MLASNPAIFERLRQDSNLLPSASKSSEGGIQGGPERSIPTPAVLNPRGSIKMGQVQDPSLSPPVLQGPRTDVDRMWTGTVPEALLTAREVASLLRVSTWTIYALAARKELPHVRISNALRFRREDVQAFLSR